MRLNTTATGHICPVAVEIQTNFPVSIPHDQVGIMLLCKELLTVRNEPDQIADVHASVSVDIRGADVFGRRGLAAG